MTPATPPEGWGFSYEPHLMTIQWLPGGSNEVCQSNAAQQILSPTAVLIQPGGECLGTIWDLEHSVRRVRLVETMFSLTDSEGQLQHIRVPVGVDIELASS